MSRIRGKNTKPEKIVRCGLFARGLRFRLHDPKLPGRPDLVLSRYRTVIFVNGCFWHGHSCHFFRMPSTNVGFWESKIRRNKENDVKNITSLTSSGWKVITVWECAIRGKSEDEVAKMIEALVVKITNPFSEHVSCIPDLAG